MSLQGKVAVVTGAARGLGRAYALRLAGLGADVAIIDVDLDGAAKYGESLSAPSVSAESSKPSVVSDEDIRLTFDVNLMSTIYCCQAVVPAMKRQQSGVIVNTSSTAGRMVAAGGSLSHYGVSKAAVTHYTRNLAAELGPFGIRANCIAPGVMLTARIKALARDRGIGNPSEAARIPLRRLGEPEDCARVVEFLVTDLSRYVTGQCISVCGGAALTAA